MEGNQNNSFVRRMLYAMLRPAARIADWCGVSLKEFTNLAQLALYDAKRSRGQTQKAIADDLDVSSRTIDRLVKALREGIFEPEQEHGLARRIEFMLWAEPAGVARIAQVLDETEGAIEQALDTLVDDDRIRFVDGRTPKYAPTRRANRIYDADLAARVDALNNVLDVVGAATTRRFFQDDGRAAARAVSMRVRHEDVGEFEQLYEQHVWPTLVRLDEAATDDTDTIDLGFTMVWSPIGEETDEEDT